MVLRLTLQKYNVLNMTVILSYFMACGPFNARLRRRKLNHSLPCLKTQSAIVWERYLSVGCNVPCIY